MGIPGEGLTISISIRTKIPNRKQKARFAITEITNQGFRQFLKEFNNSPYLGYKIKQVYNEQTGAYFLLIKWTNKPIKIEMHIRLCNKGVKSGVNKKVEISTKQFSLSYCKSLT